MAGYTAAGREYSDDRRPTLRSRAGASMTVLLGIDLGTRACAVVACPTDWDGQWPRVRSVVVGEPLRRDATDAERARRTETIAMRLVAFARETGASQAWIESPAYSQNTAAHVLGALRGVVSLELVRAGVDIRTAPMSSARKLFLGRLPRADVKVAVYQALRSARGDVPDDRRSGRHVRGKLGAVRAGRVLLRDRGAGGVTGGQPGEKTGRKALRASPPSDRPSGLLECKRIDECTNLDNGR
jgi:hypothetical protein